MQQLTIINIMLKYILEQANDMKLRVNFAKHNNQKVGGGGTEAKTAEIRFGSSGSRTIF
jgi:replication initiation and membrane attachment protein DnaB